MKTFLKLLLKEIRCDKLAKYAKRNRLRLCKIEKSSQEKGGVGKANRDDLKLE